MGNKDGYMKFRITEKQYNNIILVESENDAFNRATAKKKRFANLKAIWADIDERQRALQDAVFGELGEKLQSIAALKGEQMGSEFAEVPDIMFRAGNKKLPPSVLIVNMSSSLMCPSFYLGLCTIKKGACYAQGGENQHTNNVLPQRWKTDLMNTQLLQMYRQGNTQPMQQYFDLVERYIDLANTYADNLWKEAIENTELNKGEPLSDEEKKLLWYEHSNNRIKDIRLNETGDFQCQLAVDLWDDFAGKLKEKYNINTHAYTARNLDFSRVNNIAINASHEGINVGNKIPRKFKAVPDEFYDSLTGGTVVKNRQPELAERKLYNGKTGEVLRDENGDEMVMYYYKCPCKEKENIEHCRRCGVCFAKNETGLPYTIYVRYHGAKNASGLKALFKKEDIRAVIEKLHEEGWVTDEEFATFNSPTNQQNLDDLDKNIDRLRSAATPKEKKPKNTKGNGKKRPKTKKTKG